MGVRLDVDVWREVDRPEGSPSDMGEVVSSDVATGTNDEPLRFTMWVKSSLFESPAPGALAERPMGNVSWSGLRSEVNRNAGGDLGRCSAEGVVGVGRAVDERPTVVSTTIGESSVDGMER